MISKNQKKSHEFDIALVYDSILGSNKITQHSWIDTFISSLSYDEEMFYIFTTFVDESNRSHFNHPNQNQRRPNQFVLDNRAELNCGK